MADTLKDKLTNIAKAIRAKSGKENKLSLDNMAEEIEKLGATSEPLIEGEIKSIYNYIDITEQRVIRQGDTVMVNVKGHMTYTHMIEGEDVFSLPKGWEPKNYSQVRCVLQNENDSYGHRFVRLELNANNRHIKTTSLIV